MLTNKPAIPIGLLASQDSIPVIALRSRKENYIFTEDQRKLDPAILLLSPVGTSINKIYHQVA
jgi:hypothetical protein